MALGAVGAAVGLAVGELGGVGLGGGGTGVLVGAGDGVRLGRGVAVGVDVDCWATAVGGGAAVVPQATAKQQKPTRATKAYLFFMTIWGVISNWALAENKMILGWKPPNLPIPKIVIGFGVANVLWGRFFADRHRPW